MHISIPVANSMEYIDKTQISPLISHAKVKVCYVGQNPNRNGTIITKEVAMEMGKKIPGSPVVAFYNKEAKDFEGHNRDISIENGQVEIIETTKPYGFVPTDAKVWFEKFLDDGIEHEYLVTECYLWTGAYPETKRILEHGNNQSMELNKENQEGFWTNDINSGKRIFIYNEALIEKLCVLGQQVEPCFEGAQITAFSLNSEEFMKNMYSMITELQDTLNKGGSQKAMNNEKEVTTPETVDISQSEFEKKPDEKEKDKDQKPQDKEESPENKDKEEDKKDKEDKKKEYNLEEIAEYAALKVQYTTLQNQFSALQQEKAKLDNEIASLRQFKLITERQNKQSMIDSFYMLSDEDKKDVINNMDTYSIDDIEAKLSILCVRNKVNFSQDNNQNNETSQSLFSLSGATDNSPEWLKAVRSTAKN